ncbi:MAG: pilus assembly protein PilZ [Gammaproteobacteria bacterium]|nr:MAG: pilus assembly protein PilZ [Gammaproteobacteria bacterium]
MEQILIEFASDHDLFLSYMPFLKNGGIFVRTIESYELGDDIMLEITLPDSLESSEVKGCVCWLTPVGANNGTPAGIGISFVEDKDHIRNQIEKELGRHLNSSEATLTM